MIRNLIICLVLLLIAGCGSTPTGNEQLTSNTSAEACFMQGVNYSNKDNFTEAIKAFEKAISIKPDYVEAYYELGNIYELLSNYEKAVQCYKHALAINLFNPEIYYKLGEIYSKRLNQPEEAISCYNKFLQIAPADDPRVIEAKKYFVPPSER